MQGPYLEYSSSVVKHVCTIWKAYLFRMYASNVKYMFNSVPGYIVDCSEVTWGIYADIVVWYLHIN